MPTVLRIGNVASRLETDDKELRELLWGALRFMEKGAFHSTLYKKGLWDGHRDFFDKNSGGFRTGLLPEVLAALKIRKVKFAVDDRRPPAPFAVTEIDDQFLNRQRPAGMRETVLRDYQVDFVNQALKHRRGIIQSPTGATVGGSGS